MAERPIGREKRVGGSGGGVQRGAKVSTGPVGSGSGGGSGRASGSFNTGGSGGSGGSGGGLIKIILIIAVVLLGGGGGLGGFILSGGGGSDDPYSGSAGNTYESSTQSSSSSDLLGSLIGGSSGYNANPSAEWTLEKNTGRLDTSQVKSARAPYTTIKGDGTDKTTIMVYMCGTDLESKSGMATKDLQEMAAAKLNDNVRVIVFTGGCKAWKNNVISNSKNQIYEVTGGGLKCIEKDMGSKPMTDPDNLSDFIKYASGKYPADRYDLIFWDHGGGSKSGYGYDEKNASYGSMSLAGIEKALKNGGIKYDFIGFDACLMATVETAIVTARYADYLIASEETEPGVGWYYTTWLTDYAANPSMATIELGQEIIDTFTDTCARSCSGQKTTLSLTDLAELETTVPDALNAFFRSTTDLVESDSFKQVAKARADSREFAVSSRIDQVDLVHLAAQMGTDEGDALRDTLLSAVKYNRVSSGMTNAYGLSAYFPGQSRSKISAKSIADLYKSIGIDDEYTRCVTAYDSKKSDVQYASTGGANPETTETYGGTTVGGMDMLTLFIALGGMSALDMGFSDRDISSGQYFDEAGLEWQSKGDQVYLSLPEDQWELVTDLELNMVYDDGQGYLNLGLDNVFTFDDRGNLLAPDDRTWIALDGNIVSYYHISTTGGKTDYEIMGRVPVLLNGEYANLILVFSAEQPYGYVAGATYDYRDGQTETVAKNLTELNEGDTIVFICDGFSYDGTYDATYELGKPYTVQGDMRDIEITNEDVGDGTALCMYRFVDIYGAEHYTNTIAP